MRALILAATLACLAFASVAAAQASWPALTMSDPMGARPAMVFPGGLYKSSTSANIPSATVSGALVTLKPGGMRELHWHQPNEWALVLNGTCRATVLLSGSTHEFDTWDFTAGDIWYFPSNTGHAILGLEPTGCSFVAGFDDGAFDEINSFSMSSWLATVSPDILAQSLGVTVSAAAQLKATSLPQDGKPNFMPMGKRPDVFRDTPSISRQFPPLIHRFPLATQNVPEVLKPDGSYINMVDVTLFPASDRMVGALVKFAPGAIRQLHWHTTLDEWQFIINGTYEAGVFLQPGVSTLSTLNAGDVGFAGKGTGHWIKNKSDFEAYMVLIFRSDDGKFTDIESGNFMGAFPPAWVAASLNTTSAFAESINSQNGFAPKLTTQQVTQGMPVLKAP